MKLITRIACCALAVISLISCTLARVQWIPADETDHFTFSIAKGAKDDVPLLAQELEATLGIAAAELDSAWRTYLHKTYP